MNCQGSNLISDTLALGQIRIGLDHIYNYEFDSAGQTLTMLEKNFPAHPITSLFDGLILYWKYYPLIPGGEGSVQFEDAMKTTWERAISLKTHPGSDIEGVFFDLMSRSFIVMYYSDNGISTKAIGHLGTIYRGVMDGFEMLDEFREFYFITGLYSYYREAYIEAHPVYKPISIFFKKGDKEKGLEMLEYASRECDFMHVEARLFLTLIEVNFESRPDHAVSYSEKLHAGYPGNGYFLAEYAEMLLINKQYENALAHIHSLLTMDKYNRMKGNIYLGMYNEKYLNDLEKARVLYEEGLELAAEYGEMANYSKAYAYMGLSRYYSMKGNTKLAREYRRKAGNSTNYGYVLEDQNTSP